MTLFGGPIQLDMEPVLRIASCVPSFLAGPTVRSINYSLVVVIIVITLVAAYQGGQLETK